MPLALKSSGGGSVTIDVPSTASDFTQTLLAASGTLAPLVTGTIQNTTSGTFIDFTGIPSWAKRITVMFNGFSVSGSSIPIIQLGTASSIETSSYLGSAGGSDSTSGNSVAANSTGFNLFDTGNAAHLLYGAITLTLMDAASNLWTASGTLGTSSSTRCCFWMGGTKALASVLTRLRVTTINGTDTFDAGTINIMYEG
jgi:hypothetical protein